MEDRFGANAIGFSLGEKATEGEGGLPQIIYRIHSAAVHRSALYCNRQVSLLGPIHSGQI